MKLFNFHYSAHTLTTYMAVDNYDGNFCEKENICGTRTERTSTDNIWFADDERKKRLEIVLKTNEILVTRRLHVPRSTSVDSQRIKAMQMDIYTYVCVGWYVCDDHTFPWNNIRCAHGDEHTLEKRSMMRGTNTHSYVRFEYYVFIVLCIIMVGDSFAVVWLKI